MNVLNLKDQQFAIDDHLLFHLPETNVQEGAKIALIGANGTGKTTLFQRILAASQGQDPRITVQQSLAYLPQDMPLPSMSGGEQTKRQLLPLLNGPAGCLLLDEPSTNLDQAHQAWLTNALAQTSKTLLFISHERSLLTTIPTQIWWIEEAELHVFSGNFQEFEAWQAQRKAKQTADYRRQQQQRQKLYAEIQRRKEKAARMQRRKPTIAISDWKDQAGTTSYDKRQLGMAKSAKSLEKRLAQQHMIQKPVAQKPIQLQVVGELAQTKGSFFQLLPQSLTLANRTKLALPLLTVRSGQHIALSGANGSGKTSFLQALYQALREENSAITLTRFHSLSPGYFEQTLQAFPPTTSLEAFVRQDSLQPPQKIYDLLGGLGFDRPAFARHYSTLSGGEKIRANLARILVGNHSLLLLDEPNNYLDLAAQKVVRDFLADYPGTFLLVSHDSSLLQATCQIHFEIAEGKLVDTALIPEKNQPAMQDELTALHYQKDHYIQDPTLPISELQAILRKIATLQKKNTPK